MRTLTLLAAITMMHMAHAIPRPDLTVRQDGDDINNQSHVFHHLDRNPLTADRDRDRLHRNEERSPTVEKQKQERSKLDVVLERRFMRSPDYSQGGSSGGGSNSASAVSDTMPTPQPAAKAEKQPAEMARL